MKLILVRHGQAVPERADVSRPLSPAGQEEVRKAGNELKEKRIPVDKILHSPLKRAQETAEILARIAGKKGAPCSVLKGLMPNDPTEIMEEVIRIFEIEHPKQALMLVGHLPYMGVLLAKLLKRKEDSEEAAFGTGTIAVLEFDSRGQWRLLHKIIP